MSKLYVHYGSDHFDPDKFTPIKSVSFSNKPIGGLWASPCDSENSWYDFSLGFNADRLDKWFTFTLKDDAKVLTIKTEQDLYELADAGFCVYSLNGERNHWRAFYPDFNKLCIAGYDAIEVYMTDTIYWNLYGWDVDSLLVLNPNCVKADSNV